MTSRSVPALGALLLFGLVGCHKAEEPPTNAPPPGIPVSVAIAQRVDAPILLRTIGTVESKARVMLRPQVAARVESLSAPEGSAVTAGQELILLDAGPFEALLRQAQADLARSRALADDAHRLVERISEAAASAAVSKRELEEVEAKARAADADVASNNAKVETARFNVSYCSIAAPFSGRLGAYMVKPGAIVKSEEADLVELVQVDPIEVGFSVTEDKIPSIGAAMAKGPVSVEALPSGETAAPATGTLTFIDSKVDLATGTLRLKATFANPDGRLWPGRFSNVTILLGHEPDSVSIPESAVVPSQAGLATFIVGADQTVELREIKVRRTMDGRSIIASGVAAGETVVTEGQLRLGPKSKVQIKADPGAPPPPPPSSKP